MRSDTHPDEDHNCTKCDEFCCTCELCDCCCNRLSQADRLRALITAWCDEHPRLSSRLDETTTALRKEVGR